MAADNWTVERSTTIDAAPERVYEQLADFHQWRSWSPWEDLDPDLQRDYSGPESGTGAVYRWSGNRKAGSGRMEIVSADATASASTSTWSSSSRSRPATTRRSYSPRRASRPRCSGT